MTWWLWGVGTGTPPVTTSADNAPSLWSGGVRWGDPAAPFGDGTDGYWGATTAATGRTGRPRLSVAIGGGLVLEQLMEADWDLGRSDWLSVLSPAGASFRFVDVPIAAVNDSIVVGLMSDAEEYHSDSLWVGRVTNVGTDRNVDDTVFSSVSATDVVGILGQADSPTGIVEGYTLKTLTEALAEDAGIALEVDTDALVTLPTLTAAGVELDPTDALSGKVLDLINRAERSSNALLFLKGSGRLHAAMRDTTGESSATVIDLDGDDSPSSWSENTGIDSVVTRWQLGGTGGWATDTEATTLEDYGEQAYSATDLLITDPVPYAALIASDVMAHPRPILTAAPIPVRDLAQRALYINPLDRVTSDGETWQVMSVHHTVRPIEVEEGLISAYGDWRVTIGADATQEALVGADEPGPVTPPALNTVTLTYTATKGATASITAGGSGGGTDLGDLRVGKYGPTGTKYRSAIDWSSQIVWPTNTIRVVSASVRLVTSEANDDPRIQVRRNTESWSEGSMTWGGPATTTAGMRSVDMPRGAGVAKSVTITGIAEAWRSTGINYGISLRSVSEDSAGRYAAFASDDSSESDIRPILTIVVEVVS